MVHISTSVSMIRTHGNVGNLGNSNPTFPLDIIRYSAHQDAEAVYKELYTLGVYDAPSFLKYLRTKGKITQKQLAELMFIKSSRYQQLETGISQNLTEGDIAILRDLKIVDDWIFDVFLKKQ